MYADITNNLHLFSSALLLLHCQTQEVPNTSLLLCLWICVGVSPPGDRPLPPSAAVSPPLISRGWLKRAGDVRPGWVRHGATVVFSGGVSDNSHILSCHWRVLVFPFWLFPVFAFLPGDFPFLPALLLRVVLFPPQIGGALCH